jgi:hypothetical protein
MFGILRPELSGSHLASRQEYTSTYCNLCGHLRLRYGLKSRILVVHDIATLSWLLTARSTANFPLMQANCVRGLGQKSRPASPRWTFLAAISAHSISCARAFWDLCAQIVRRSFLGWKHCESNEFFSGEEKSFGSESRVNTTRVLTRLKCSPRGFRNYGGMELRAGLL